MCAAAGKAVAADSDSEDEEEDDSSAEGSPARNRPLAAPASIGGPLSGGLTIPATLNDPGELKVFPASLKGLQPLGSCTNSLELMALWDFTNRGRVVRPLKLPLPPTRQSKAALQLLSSPSLALWLFGHHQLCTVQPTSLFYASAQLRPNASVALPGCAGDMLAGTLEKRIGERSGRQSLPEAWKWQKRYFVLSEPQVGGCPWCRAH